MTLVNQAIKSTTKPLTATAINVNRIGYLEHCLSADSVSPMVSLAMSIPAGTKYSASEVDSGQIAAAYKHTLLQGTKQESRISLARKADLRPSPIGVTLTRDLLTIHSNFHVNYLPEMVETFQDIYTGLQVTEYDVETLIKPATYLDGAIAAQDNRVLLSDLAYQVAFRANGLYFSDNSNNLPITKELLEKFHQNTLNRPKSLLISVNDKSVLTPEQFNKIISENGHFNATLKDHHQTSGEGTVYYGGEMRIESFEEENEILIGLPIRFGGYLQPNFWSTRTLEALLQQTISKKYSGTEVFSTVTQESSLLNLRLRFDQSRTAKEVHTAVRSVLADLRGLPERVKEDDLIRAQTRAHFNLQTALDSRQNRLLTHIHSPTISIPQSGSVDQLRSVLCESLNKESIQKLTLVTKGINKKLPYLSELIDY